MYQDLIKNLKTELEKTVSHLRGELASFRTGRANPSLVEEIMVNYYGTPTPLKQTASISAPESNLLVIQPWDSNALESIEKAINDSNLGLQATDDGQFIRVKIPPLTEERRKDLTRQLHQKLEEAKISVRHHRERVWKDLQNMEKEGTISEDDKFKSKDELQKIVDEINKEIDQLGQRKEEEILGK